MTPTTLAVSTWGQRSVRQEEAREAAHLDDLVVDPDPAVPVGGSTGSDRLDEDTKLLQARVSSHTHT